MSPSPHHQKRYTTVLDPKPQKRKLKLLQLCLTLCDPMDYSLPGSSFHGILQARILEWVAISFSRGSSQSRDQTWVSHMAGGFSTDWATGEAKGSLSGDRDVTDGLVKMRSLGQTLTQEDQVLMKRGNLDPEDDVKPWGECHMKREDWRMHPLVKERQRSCKPPETWVIPVALITQFVVLFYDSPRTLI